jgi:4,5-dihydroxyphthalate decarboxylase
MALRLSLACENTDRTRALIDGRVTIEGCEVCYVGSEPEDIFQRAFRHGEFDIAELSFSTHVLTTARGDGPYIGIPAFVSRAFRHSAIYVRNDRNIRAPSDLKGCRVGVPDYQQTAGVWVRGMLAEEYDVRPSDIRWFTGGLEEAGRKVRVPLKLPSEISVQPIAPTATLSGLLAEGELDAVIAPRAPSCLGGNTVVRLFPDYRRSEEDYFRKTGLFPIMHLVGIRRDLAKQHPWLPVNVYRAFLRAKAIAVDELTKMDFARATHPWIADEIARVKTSLGDDFWRYGADENSREIGAMVRYATADGLISRPLEASDLFAPSTFDSYRI